MLHFIINNIGMYIHNIYLNTTSHAYEIGLNKHCDLNLCYSICNKLQSYERCDNIPPNMKYPSYNPSNNICHFCYCKRIYSVLFLLFGIRANNIQQSAFHSQFTMIVDAKKETNKWIDIVFFYKSIERNDRFMSFCHFVQRHTHEMPSNHLILYLVFGVAWHGVTLLLSPALEQCCCATRIESTGPCLYVI